MINWIKNLYDKFIELGRIEKIIWISLAIVFIVVPIVLLFSKC